MPIDTSSPRSRRAMLAAAVGAIAATAAGAVIPRSSATAANGDTLILGSSTNVATATTQLSNTTNSLAVLMAETTNGVGLEGQALNGTAVFGAATIGAGVAGDATSGKGVVGTAIDGAGIGVEGHSPTGIGVYAKSENAVALHVDGKVHFSRSGRTWIRAGHSTVTVTAQGTAANSRVFAVLASNRPSRYVRAVVPTTDTFTVYLNASALSDSVVTWFILD